MAQPPLSPAPPPARPGKFWFSQHGPTLRSNFSRYIQHIEHADWPTIMSSGLTEIPELAAGPGTDLREVARTLFSICVHVEPPMAPAGWRVDHEVSRAVNSRANVVLNILLQTALQGKDPEQALAQYSQVSMCCTAVWTPNSMFYRCRDCGLTPSSSLCVHCFKAGNHEGHDFSIDRSRYGGCCDCGTEAAWKKEGFCANHAGSDPENDPADQLQAAARRDLSNLILAVSECLWSLLQGQDVKVEGTKTLPGDALAMELTSWLRQMCRGCDAYRSVACAVFVDNALTLKFLSSAGPRVYALTDELTNLHLDMLCHPSYKKPFSEAFLVVYPKLLQGAPEETHHGLWCKMLLEKTSVQLFNVKELTMDLTKNNRLMDMLWKTVTDQLRGTLAPGTLRETSIVRELTRAKADFLDRPWYILCTDISTAITHPEIAALHWEKEALTRAVFEFVGLFQGMHEQKRRAFPEPHVEYETNVYIRSFNVHLDLTRIVMTLLKGYTQDRLSAKRFLSALKYWELSLLTHVASQHMRWDPAQPFGCPALEHYAVISQPVSFHHPLHHVYALLISSAARSASSLQEICPVRPKNMLMIIELPLRVTVLIAHIEARLWVRNGEATLSRQAAIYRRSGLSREFWLFDLILLQAASCVFGGRLFYLLLRQRFELGSSPVISSHLPSDRAHLASQPVVSLSNPAEVIIATSLFETIIAMWSQTLHFGGSASAQAQTDHEVIQRLALGPQTHSHLTDAKSRASTDQSDDLRVTLERLANYTPPTESREATFSLKPEFYKDFDPFYYRYTRSESDKAWERFEEEYGKEKGIHVLLQPTSPNLESLGVLNGLPGILRVPELHQAIYRVLRNSAEARVGHHASQFVGTVSSSVYLCSERLLSTVIRLLALIVREDLSREELSPEVDESGKQSEDCPYTSRSMLENALVYVQHDAALDGDDPAVTAERAWPAIPINTADEDASDDQELDESTDVVMEESERGPAAASSMDVDTSAPSSSTMPKSPTEHVSLAEVPRSLLDVLARHLDPAADHISQFHRDAIAQLIRLFGEDDECLADLKSRAVCADLFTIKPASPTTDDTPSEESAAEKRKAAMRARQAAIQAQMQASMSAFEEANEMGSADQEMNDTSNRRVTIDGEDLQCCICLKDDGLPVSHFLGLITTSNLAEKVGHRDISWRRRPVHEGRQAGAYRFPFTWMNEQEGRVPASPYDSLIYEPVTFSATHVQTCDHAVHLHCFQRFHDGLASQVVYEFGGHRDPVNPASGEFMCPVCKRLSNTIVPVVSTEDFSIPVDTPGEFCKISGTVTLSEMVYDRMEDLTVDTHVEYYPHRPMAIAHPLYEKSKRWSADREDCHDSPPVTTYDPLALWPVALRIDECFEDIAQSDRRFNDMRHDLLHHVWQVFIHGNINSSQEGLSRMRTVCKASTPCPVAAWNAAASTLTCIEIAHRGKDSPLALDRRQRATILALLKLQDFTRWADVPTTTYGHDYVPDLTRNMEGRVEGSLLYLLSDDALRHDMKSYDISLLQTEVFPVLVRLVAALMGSESDHHSCFSWVSFYIVLCYRRVCIQATIMMLSDILNEDISFEELTLPFLRQTVLLLLACRLLSADLVNDTFDLIEDKTINSCTEDYRLFNGDYDRFHAYNQAEGLRVMLGLETPSLADLQQGYPLLEKVDWKIIRNTLPQRQWLPRPIQFTLRREYLPHKYLDLVEMVYNRRCRQCNTVPGKPGLCLICGDMICIGSDCCRVHNSAVGEAFVHAYRCYGGVGVILDLNAAVVHLLRDNRLSKLKRLYVDEYGQPDPNLVRGRPLFLQERALSQLTDWIAENALDRQAAVLDQSNMNASKL